MMNVSRKRVRSAEEEFGIQTKYFVNQKMVERQSNASMQNVYEKTLSMIYNGAKLQNQKQQVPKNVNQILLSPGLDTVDDKLSETKGCMLCWKDVETTVTSLCKNCNLKICYTCSLKCLNCSSNLCCNCVNIFGCSYNENPICEDCKLYIE